MVRLARPQRAAPAAQPPAAAPPPPLSLRGGGDDTGFCVRGALPAPAAPAASADATHRRHAALPFSALSRALFGRLAANPLFDLAAVKVASGADLHKMASASKMEHFSVVRVRADGRCMFRSLALGLAALKNISLNSTQEEREADLLRTAVQEAICVSVTKRNSYPQAVFAIKTEMEIPTYCKRIASPSFWGGEPELLVLCEMLKLPIDVYLPAGVGVGFVKLVRYGQKHETSKAGKARRPVKLLYNGVNHYDLLL